MIEITVSGDTYDIRKRLKDERYRWHPILKAWTKTISECVLDAECDKLRPMRSWSDTPDPKVIVSLRKVDAWGKPFSPEVRVRLKSVARPGDKTISEVFEQEISIVSVSPTPSPDPTDDKPRKSIEQYGSE